MVNSLKKGKRGEREVVKLLQEYGFEARRGQQFAGGPDSPDVVHSIPNVHIEVKFRQQLNLYDALQQAKKDDPDKVSVIFHRKKNKKWLVTLEAEEFLDGYAGKGC